jgi:DNA-binding LacI/PurR family transcriptional regulator
MATIKDVASRAGVAPSTVSYVLSGSRQISEKTRAAVRQAIEELGYHPSASARTLRSARTQVLALALPRSGEGYRPTDGRFAIELCDAARAHGYDVLMLTEREGLPGLRRMARGGQADGAILMAVGVDDPRVPALRELGLPFALLGTELAPEDGEQDFSAGAPFADLDWTAAAELALTAAAESGHRSLAYLPCAAEEVTDRKGYALRGLAGAHAAGRRLTGRARVRVLEPPSGAYALRARLDALLDGPEPPTALAVQHVGALPTVLAAAQRHGLRVPEELCVLPVGSLPGEPGGPLPRIELPVSAMTAAVTELVVSAIDSRDRHPGHRLIAPVLLDPEPLRRHGTA